MNHYPLYHAPIPAFLREAAEAPVVARLKGVGMNCGCEYTAFPRFRALQPYSRWEHSLGVALIVWRFTRDPAQALAGLLHDVATPVFAHVVDFMRGDYLTQEATEDGTEAMIAGSAELQSILGGLGLTTDDVRDYHRYPVADNDAPRLSADRLEYTLGNCLNYGFCDLDTVRRFYGDLAVGKDEDGRDELSFQTEAVAREFAFAALRCARVYVSDEDRYAMQRLSELLKYAVEGGVLDEGGLYATEPEVIARLLDRPDTAARWREYRSYSQIVAAPEPGDAGHWRKIHAKKRRVDPMVLGRGRVSALCPEFAAALEDFMAASQDYWICGRP